MTGMDFASRPVSRDALETISEKFEVKNEESAPASKIFENIVEKLFIGEEKNPVFLIGFPQEFSPLAKSEDGKIAQRFELYINGMEIANAYSELNDPASQREFFLKQVEDRADKTIDADYIEALEYGMPPTGGLGIGIDRLVMVLANTFSIKDVIIFPQLKVK